MPDRDLVLLETVKTHRARLVSAFLSGELAERRVINDNVRRLIGGVVVAAVFCAACVGFSFVSAQLGKQAAQQKQQQGLGPATGPVFASDTFDRNRATGWGAAERGGTWRLAGPASSYAVADGAGVIKLSDRSGNRTGTAAELGGYLPGLEQDRSDVTVTVAAEPVVATGGSVTVELLGRRVSSAQDYRAVVHLTHGGGTSIALVRTSADQVDQAVEQISNTVSTPGSADAGNQPMPVSIRMQVIGTNPTTIRAKVWTGGSEPQGWTVTGSDSTQDLQRPGTIGLLAAEATLSGKPSDLAVDDLIGRTAP